jgi:nitrate/TMAO reductase-like tetraheme cytochrome c subunit
MSSNYKEYGPFVNTFFHFHPVLPKTVRFSMMNRLRSTLVRYALPGPAGSGDAAEAGHRPAVGWVEQRRGGAMSQELDEKPGASALTEGPGPAGPAPKKRKKRLVVGLSTLGILLVVFVASVQLTSTSRFCAVCHYMKPFYQSWQTSSHSHIECSTCHYAPGLRSKLRAKMEGLVQVARYWSKLYLKSKPWAEIPDESCLRPGCHDKRLLEGQVKFQKVVFDHTIHFTDLKRGKTLRCTTCHSQIVQGEHITVTESSCFICHFKKSDINPQADKCSLCHKQADLVPPASPRFNHTVVFEKGFSCDKCHSQVVVGDGAVPRENCYRCHFEGARLDQYGNTNLIHATHITAHKIECTQCHLAIQHKIIKDIETIADCRTCHTGPHQAQKILYTGEGGKGISHPMPNVMLQKGLSCKGCHVFHEEKGQLVKSETLRARSESCEACHGKGFARLQRDWALAAASKIRDLRAITERAGREVRGSRHAKKAEAQALLDEAAFNMDLIERGKSVHNITYSQALIAASWNQVNEALRLIGSTYVPEKIVFQASAAENPCLSCHSGIEEIAGTVFGLKFPHKRHLVTQNIECSTCHSNAKTHGEFVATKQTCAGCHHQDPKKDCAACHGLQKTLHEGGEVEGVAIAKDIMAEAGIDCAACHLDAKNRLARPGAGKCVECHGKEEYGKMFGEWQTSIKTLTTDLEAALREARKSALSDEQTKLVQRTEDFLKKLAFDGSWGVHNHVFLEDYLTKTLKTIKSLVSSRTP